MVEVTVAKLGIDSSTNAYVVILQEKGGNRVLPIWIGQPEAESIAMQMNDIRRERPLTHDLCKSIIVGLGGSLRRVQITRVQQNTYFAELHILRGDGFVHIDARPSDSIAIALRLDAPIFADESLFAGTLEESESEEEPDTGGVPIAEKDPDELSTEELRANLERMRPEDFGKFMP